MTEKVIVNKPGTGYSISLNLGALFSGEESFNSAPCVMGITPPEGQPIAPGDYESGTIDSITLMGSGAALVVLFNPQTLEDLETVFTAPPNVVVNPCTHLVISPSELFVITELPSKALPAQVTSGSAGSSKVTVNGCSVVIGDGAGVSEYAYAVAIGASAGHAESKNSLSIGVQAAAAGNGAIAIGGGGDADEGWMNDSINGYNYAWTTANGQGATAIGLSARARGDGAIAIGNYVSNCNSHSIVLGGGAQGRDRDEMLTTRLFLMPAGSPLANKYEDGAACMGYTVQRGPVWDVYDGSESIIECGTRKLSEIFTNNTAFAPMALDPDVEHTPFNPDADGLPYDKEVVNKRQQEKVLPENPLLADIKEKLKEKIASWPATSKLESMVKQAFNTTTKE